MKAWIVKWNWIGEHAAVKRPVVAILSARLHPDEVRKRVEFLYAVTHSSLREQMEQARYNDPAKPAYPAQFSSKDGVPHQGLITCGHNPFLEAYQVEGLCLVTNDDGEETPEWTPHAQKQRS